MCARISSLLTLVLALAASACGAETECNSMYVVPEVPGSFEASSVPFSNASELLVCLNETCDAEIAGRVSIRVERAPAEHPPFGSSTSTPAKLHKVAVRYSTAPPSMVEPKTGDIVRLRYPNRPEGPWTVDVSLRAQVTPSSRCTPTTGTLQP